MKALIYPITAALLLAANLHAQTGGPDAYGYTWESGATYELVEHTSAARTVLTPTSDNFAATELTIPWGGIYGTPIDSIVVSRHGYISLGGLDLSDDAIPQCLPAVPAKQSVEEARIYARHLEMTGGSVFYEYFPDSPHRQHQAGVHVITWQDIQQTTIDDQAHTVQLLLFDNLQFLIQQNGAVPENPDDNATHTVGILSPDSSIALQFTCPGAKGTIGPEAALLFSPPTVNANLALDQNSSLSLRNIIAAAAPGTRIRTSGTAYPVAGPNTLDTPLDLDGKVLAIDWSSRAPRLPGAGPQLIGVYSQQLMRVTGSAWVSVYQLGFHQGGNSGNTLAGGAVEIDGSTFIVNNSDFLDNEVASTGGAISAINDSLIVIHRCEFSSNSSAGNGGAIDVRDSSLRLGYTHFNKNTARFNGGAIALRDASLDLEHSEFTHNTTGRDGAALYVERSDADFFAATFDNNRASRYGGAVYVTAPASGATPSDLAFSRCTFFENFASAGGGAIADASDASPLNAIELQFSTLYRNDGGTGGGGAFFLGDNNPVVGAIIMADNSNDQIANFPGGGGTLTKVGESIETGSEGNFAPLSGESNVDDIRLTPLGGFGGFVRVCMPLEGCPAINFNTGLNAPGTDARGLPGITSGNIADAGAVELGPVFTVTTEDPDSMVSGSFISTFFQASSTGGVIRFDDSIEIIDLSGRNLFTGSGTQVFIEAPTDRPLCIEGGSISASLGSSVAFHAIRLRELLFGMRGKLTFHDCHVSFCLSDSPLFEPRASDFSFLNSTCTRNINSFGIFDFSGGRAFLRDSLIETNEHSGISTASPAIISASDQLLFINRSSFIGNEIARTDQSNRVTATIHLTADSDRLIGTIENSTFSGNLTRRSDTSTSASVHLDANQFADQTNFQPIADFDITHCTFANQRTVGSNAAPAHATIRLTGDFDPASNSPDLLITNSIAADNTDSVFTDTPAGTIITGGGNLADIDIPNAITGDQPNTDPLLADLSLGLNSTLHHPLHPDSPCIDNARSGFSQSHTDGRAGPRSQDSTASSSGFDIGAVESGRIITINTAIDENDATLGSGAGDSLREALTAGSQFGSVNIQFDNGFPETITLLSRYLISDIIADIHAPEEGLTLTKTTGFTLCDVQSNAAVAFHRVDTESPGVVSFTAEKNSQVTINRAEIHAPDAPGIQASDNSHVRAYRVWIRESSFPASATSIGQFTLDRCAITHTPIDAPQLIRAGSGTSRVVATRTTLAHNHTDLAVIGEHCEIVFDRVTCARNSGDLINFSDTGRYYVRRSIFHNQISDTLQNGPSLLVRSRGENLTERLSPELDHSSDITGRGIFLGPLNDYDDDGVPEMPPLAVDRHAFGKEIGATDPPPTLTVTNTSDQFIPGSLTNAMANIPAGGTILFDPSLDGAAIAPVSIATNSSYSIDATSLSNGITFTNGVSVGSGSQAYFGINFDGGDLLPRAINATSSGENNLTVAHCSFTHSGIGISFSKNRLVAENCTFEAGSGGISFSGDIADISYNTFYPSDLYSVLNNGVGQMELTANVFRDDIVGVDYLSLGNNIFATDPPFATATDLTTTTISLPSVTENGGWPLSYLQVAGDANISKVEIPIEGSVPPPYYDTRGYPRLPRVGAGIDAGSVERDAEELDSDSDGMPDYWEHFYGLAYLDVTNATADPDGDNADNLTEFQNGTDPLVPDAVDVGLPTFISVNKPAGLAATFQFIGSAGIDYVLQDSDDLQSWQDVTTITMSGAPQSYSGYPTALRRYVRFRQE